MATLLNEFNACLNGLDHFRHAFYLAIGNEHWSCGKHIRACSSTRATKSEAPSSAKACLSASLSREFDISK
jgi:hypothetical protein